MPDSVAHMQISTARTHRLKTNSHPDRENPRATDTATQTHIFRHRHKDSTCGHTGPLSTLETTHRRKEGKAHRSINPQRQSETEGPTRGLGRTASGTHSSLRAHLGTRPWVTRGDWGSSAPGALGAPPGARAARPSVPVRAGAGGRARRCAPPPVGGEVRTAPPGCGLRGGGSGCHGAPSAAAY